MKNEHNSSSKLRTSRGMEQDWLVVDLLQLNIKQGGMGSSVTSLNSSTAVQHPILGHYTPCKATDSSDNISEQMNILRVVDSQEEFNRWYKEMIAIDDSVSKEVLLLPVKATFKLEGFCGSGGIAHLTYDHYPLLLSDELDNRRKKRQYFLETELQYLLYNMVRAGAKYQTLQAKVGNIHPSNIIINNDGLVKLVSRHSFPREETNFDKLLGDPHCKVFLAPEQLQSHSIERGEYPKSISPPRCECYSIGLCMLAAATLEDVDSVYYWQQQEMKIQKSKVNFYLKLLGERYSNLLYSTVKGLLTDDPQARKRCSQISSTLYQYEREILNFEPFQFNGFSPISFGVPPQGNQVQIVPIIRYQSQQPPLQMHSPIHSRANTTNTYYHSNELSPKQVSAFFRQASTH